MALFQQHVHQAARKQAARIASLFLVMKQQHDSSTFVKQQAGRQQALYLSHFDHDDDHQAAS